MSWVSAVILAIELLVKYGPRIYKLGKEIYDYIEEKTRTTVRAETPITSDEKAERFNNKVAEKLTAAGRRMSRSEINEFREAIWEKKNPGKTPKPLTDQRLMYGTATRKQGKTKWAGTTSR